MLPCRNLETRTYLDELERIALIMSVKFWIFLCGSQRSQHLSLKNWNSNFETQWYLTSSRRELVREEREGSQIYCSTRRVWFSVWLLEYLQNWKSNSHHHPMANGCGGTETTRSLSDFLKKRKNVQLWLSKKKIVGFSKNSCKRESTW